MTCSDTSIQCRSIGGERSVDHTEDKGWRMKFRETGSRLWDDDGPPTADAEECIRAHFQIAPGIPVLDKSPEQLRQLATLPGLPSAQSPVHTSA